MIITAPVGEKVRVVYPTRSDDYLLRTGTIKTGTTIISRDALPKNDRARLEILEATEGVEILNVALHDDGSNRIRTIDVSSNSSRRALTKAFIAMSAQGLEIPSEYADGFLLQLNF